MKSWFALYRILGFFPHNIHLYEQALQHCSSHLRTEHGNVLNNERLEFLGDAILGAIVSDIVYNRFTGKREGFLTNSRSNLVKRSTLNKFALDIGLDKMIVTSVNTSKTHNNYMYGNAFEAFIGAIYLDRGYSYCMRFIKHKIIHHLINLDKEAFKEQNYKSKLLEWAQKNKIRITFELVEQKLVDGAPFFCTRVNIEGIACGEGEGFSKKESHQRAAKQAWTHIRLDEKMKAQVMEAKNKRDTETDTNSQ